MNFFRPAGGPKEAPVTVVRVLRFYPNLFFTLIVLFAGTAFATDYPLTVTDDLGREVVLEAEPLRVVSMIPSQTETVCALGACDRLVGVDEYSNYPAEVTDLPVLGNGFSPNVEAIVALKPDLVLVDESGGIAETLAGLGLTVYAGTAQTYEQVFDTFEVVGELLNLEDEAASLSNKVKGEVDAVAALVADAPIPTVFYELDATPYSVGPDSYIGTLINKAGGRTIVEAGMDDFPLLDPEFVVAADPDVIVLGDAPFGESAATLKERPGWEGLRALETGRVAELTPEQVDIVNRSGPRVAEAVRLFAQIFHPDLVD